MLPTHFCIRPKAISVPIFNTPICDFCNEKMEAARWVMHNVSLKDHLVDFTLQRFSTLQKCLNFIYIIIRYTFRKVMTRFGNYFYDTQYLMFLLLIKHFQVRYPPIQIDQATFYKDEYGLIHWTSAFIMRNYHDSQIMNFSSLPYYVSLQAHRFIKLVIWRAHRTIYPTIEHHNNLYGSIRETFSGCFPIYNRKLKVFIKKLLSICSRCRKWARLHIHENHSPRYFHTGIYNFGESVSVDILGPVRCALNEGSHSIVTLHFLSIVDNLTYWSSVNIINSRSSKDVAEGLFMYEHSIGRKVKHVIADAGTELMQAALCKALNRKSLIVENCAAKQQFCSLTEKKLMRFLTNFFQLITGKRGKSFKAKSAIKYIQLCQMSAFVSNLRPLEISGEVLSPLFLMFPTLYNRRHIFNTLQFAAETLKKFSEEYMSHSEKVFNLITDLYHIKTVELKTKIKHKFQTLQPGDICVLTTKDEQDRYHLKLCQIIDTGTVHCEVLLFAPKTQKLYIQVSHNVKLRLVFRTSFLELLDKEDPDLERMITEEKSNPTGPDKDLQMQSFMSNGHILSKHDDCICQIKRNKATECFATTRSMSKMMQEYDETDISDRDVVIPHRRDPVSQLPPSVVQPPIVKVPNKVKNKLGRPKAAALAPAPVSEFKVPKPKLTRIQKQVVSNKPAADNMGCQCTICTGAPLPYISKQEMLKMKNIFNKHSREFQQNRKCNCKHMSISDFGTIENSLYTI